MYIYGLIIPILSFLLQVWPRLINRYFGVDGWRHLTTADYVRRYKRLPKDMAHKYILPAPFGYPPAIIIFLALFPKKFAEKFQFIFSPIFDSINNFIAFLATLYLTGDLVAAIFAQLVVFSTPITILEASILSSRPLSYLIFYLSFLPLLIFTSDGQIIFLLLAALMLFVLFFTHKLAIQAYLFVVLGFFLLEGNPFYILFFLTIFGCAFIFSSGLYKAIFEDHLVTLDNFRKYYDFRLHQFRKKQKETPVKDFINKLYALSFKNPLIFILGNNPWIVVLATIFILVVSGVMGTASVLNNVMLAKLNIWNLVLFVCGVLILSIKPIKFLGEGNRYIEYAVIPVAIVLGSYLSTLFKENGLVFLVSFGITLTGLILGIIYVQKKSVVEDKFRSINSDLWQVIRFLKAHEEKIRMAFFPTSLGDPVMYFVKGKALLTDSGKGVRRLKDILPVVSIPVKDIVSKYQLNYILIDETYVTTEELNLLKYKRIETFGRYKLISF